MSHEAQSLSPRKAVKRRAVIEVGEAPTSPKSAGSAKKTAGLSSSGVLSPIPKAVKAVYRVLGESGQNTGRLAVEAVNQAGDTVLNVIDLKQLSLGKLDDIAQFAIDADLYVSHPGRLHRLQTLSALHGPIRFARVDKVLAIHPGSEAMLIALHKNARTTPAVRAEIAASDEPASVLAQRFGITEQTVYKWKKRDVFGDRSHTAHNLQTVLTPAQETVVVHLRRTLLLPLDDLLAVTREFICPHVSRSGLDRCLRRHGAGNLNALKPQEPAVAHKAFKSYEPGYVHMDVKYLPQMQDESSRRYLFVAIDRATRWVFVQLKTNKTAASAQAFLKALHKACPLKITKLLTDNGKEFTDRLFASREREPSGNHEFDQLCQELGIEHRLTKPRTPRTNGMVERFNGRIADVLKTHRFNSREDMEQTLLRYVALYNHQLPQSALKSKTPMQTMKEWYASHPHLFHKRPYDRPGCDSYLQLRFLFKQPVLSSPCYSIHFK